MSFLLWHNRNQFNPFDCSASIEQMLLPLPASEPSLRFNDLLVVESIHSMNLAICSYRQKHCSPLSDEARRLCSVTVPEGYKDARAAIHSLSPQFLALYGRDPCMNSLRHRAGSACDKWRNNGECHTNAKYMLTRCRRACEACRSSVAGDEDYLYQASAREYVLRQICA